MLIIIEGPDGAGKTSLAHKLSLSTHYPIVHNDKPRTEEDRLRMMDNYIATTGGYSNAILDRCWYSEIVYGTVMRDRSCISYDQMYKLELTVKERGGGLIIHCTDHTSLLWDRLKGRGDDYIKNFNDLAAIVDMYNHVLHNMPHHLPTVKYELSKNMS